MNTEIHKRLLNTVEEKAGILSAVQRFKAHGGASRMRLSCDDAAVSEILDSLAKRKGYDGLLGMLERFATGELSDAQAAYLNEAMGAGLANGISA